MRLVFFFILCHFSIMIYGQSYVSEIVPFESNPNLRSIKEWDNGYLITSRNFINSESGTSFVEIDNDFSLKNSYDYLNVSFSRNSPFFNIQENNIIAIGDNFSGTGDHGFVKLNNEFDELTKKTFSSSSSNGGVTSSTFLNGYLYAVVEDIFQNSIDRDLKVLKVDSCGNFIWLKSMDVGFEYDHNWDISSTLNGNLILVREIFDDNNDRLSHISLISPDGEILWETLNPDLKDSSGGIWTIELSNGNIISAMSLDKFNDPHILNNDLNPVPPSIKWYNSDGEELNQAILHSPRIENATIIKLVKGKGDYFFGVGDRTPGEEDFPGKYGWIFKMDNEGNLLWNRKYHHPEYHEQSFYHQIDDVIEMDNGDLITAGIVTDLGSEGEIWVMRLNADGCLGDDCGQEITSSISDIADTPGQIYTYPNPSDGLLYFKKSLDVDMLSIVNASGTVVHKQQSFKGDHLELSFLENGLYWIVIHNRGNMVHNFSIVLER